MRLHGMPFQECSRSCEYRPGDGYAQEIFANAITQNKISPIKQAPGSLRAPGRGALL